MTNHLLNAYLQQVKILCDNEFEHFMHTWGQDFISVLSVRPNIGFKEMIIDAKTYNTQSNFNKDEYYGKAKNDSKRDLNDDDNWVNKPRTKKNKPRKKIFVENKEITKDHYVMLNNHYEVLSNLIEECKIYNNEMDSNISPGSCVKQVTKVKVLKHIEEVNFNDLIKQFIDEFASPDLFLKGIENKIPVISKIKIDQGSMTDDESSVNDMMSVLEMIQTKEKTIDKDVKGIQSRIRGVTSAFLKKSSTIKDSVINWVSAQHPQEESLIAGTYGNMIPPPISNLIKKLLVKVTDCNAYTQKIMDRYFILFKDLLRSISLCIFDLD